jgi:putative RNA 2'-phosphotransferase
MEKQLKHISKLLSLVLRHQPEYIGITLDENGWAHTDTLIEKINSKGISLSRETLQTVVDTNDKKRFAFNEGGTLIRASQGHSIAVELDLAPAVPPAYFYHGTVVKFLKAIRTEGLQKMSRQHVHLSADKDTAARVGSRRGVPVILTVRAGAMHEAGYHFYLSENGVWLTDAVPPDYISDSPLA